MPRFIFFFYLTSMLWFTSCQKEVPTTDLEYKTLGTSARNLLSASPFTALIVEISYMPGFAPNETVVNNLKTFLNTHLDKPAGIQIRLQPVASAGKPKLTLDDLVQLERKHRIMFTYGNTITVHILITDTYYSNTGTLAISYWNTSASLFGKRIAEKAGSSEQARTNLFSLLLQHEFGHLFGLVDQGSPMQAGHKDAAHGDHCNNRNCLMYYSVETSGYNGASIPVLDAACHADLKANGGK